MQRCKVNGTKVKGRMEQTMKNASTAVTGSDTRMARNYGHSYCLICCSASELHCDDDRGRVYDMSNLRLAKATKKIFEYLIIPQEDFIKLSKSKSKLYFCSTCLVFVKEIIKLEEKIETLELRIKWNAEILGRIAVSTPAVPKVMKNRNALLEIWSIFKGPVTQNYLHGALPNPYVKLTKGVDVRTKTVLPREIENAGTCAKTQGNCLQSSQSSSTSKCHFDNMNDYKGQESTKDLGDVEGEKYFCLDEEVKSEVSYSNDNNEQADIDGSSISVQTEVDLGENCLGPEDYFESSDDDLFEPVLVPIRRAPTQNNLQEHGTEVNSFKNGKESPVVTKIENFEDSDDDLFEVFVGPTHTGSMVSKPKSRLEENSRERNEQKKTEIKEGTVIPCCVTINEDDELQLRTPIDSGTLHSTGEKTLEKKHRLEVDKVPDGNATSITDSETTDENTLEPNSQIQFSSHARSSPSYTENSEARYPQKESCASVNTGTQEKEIAGMGTISEDKLVEVAVGRRTRPIRASAPKSFKHFMDNDDEENSSDESDLESHSSDSSSSEYEMEVDSANENESTSACNVRKVKNIRRFKNFAKDRTLKGAKHYPKPTAHKKARNLYVSFRKNPEMLKKTLESLSEKKDFIKCTKCEFVCFRSWHSNDQPRLREHIVNHYSKAHNPVEPSHMHTTSDGQPCYRCTKCDFFSLCVNSKEVARRKLTLHYMELHDAFEKMISRVNHEDVNGSQNMNPVKGLDYFECPYPNCGYVVLIEKDPNKKIQFENGARARLRIIEHFNLSPSHAKDRKEILPDTLIELKKGRGRYFKCTKCDYKEMVYKDRQKGIGNKISRYGMTKKRRHSIMRALNFHFMLEHIFPWKNFPGLYKYNCYEEKSGDDDILKCVASGCDYFLKIEYPVEEKSREECLLEANQLFHDKHGLSHNLNSIDYKLKEDILSANERNVNGQLEKGIKRNRAVRSCVAKKLKRSCPDSSSGVVSENSNTTDNEIDLDSNYSDSASEPDSDDSFSKRNDPNTFTTKRKSRKKEKCTADESEFLKLPNKVKDMLDTLTEGKDYLKCPKCDFLTSLSRSNPKANTAARKKISLHYAIHIPVKLTDIAKTSDDEDCYKCTKCSFTVNVNESGLKKGANKESHRRLSLHYIDIHDRRFAKYSTTTIDPLTDLVEAVDYFRCPETDCKYFLLIDKEKTTGPSAESLGRSKILTHYNRYHNPELKTAASKPILDEIDGTVCFKCPKCDFKSVVKKGPDAKFVRKGEVKARRKLKFHYTTKHITPWQNFPGLYPLKCRQEKLGEDDIVRCAYSPSECDYFVKINYIDGKSRAESRYCAYTAVRTHYWFHDPKHKLPLEKGYSSILPMYKGNKKILPMRFNFPLKGITRCNPPTSASSVNISNTSNSRISDFEPTVVLNTVTPNDPETQPQNAVISSKQSALKQPVQVDGENNSSLEGGSFSVLRRSKRASAAKRKRNDLDDYVANEKDCDKDSNVEEDSDGCRDEIVQDSLDGQNEAGNIACLDQAAEGLFTTGSASQESVCYPDKEHYRCWKCNYYSEVISSDKSKAKSYTRQNKARHRLAIHFNSTHCIEELSFRDPDKLLIVVDEKKFFKCPRCDHREEIIFNPKKHADGIQGRKNARVNLGQHFFFTHCVPESLIGSNQECGVSDPNNKDVLSEQLPTEASEDQSTIASGSVLEIADVPLAEKSPEPEYP